MNICVDKFLFSRILRLKSAEYSSTQNPINVPQGNFTHPLSLALETGKKWAAGRTVTCSFMGGSDIIKSKVEREAHKWEQFANIHFQFINDKNSDIRISFQKGGSWSYIGIDALFIPKNEATMNFGWLEDNTSDAEYQRVVMHEFGHALGAFHEHQSPSANIPWDKEAVYKYYTGHPNYWTKEDVDVNLFAKYNVNSSQFSEFDTKSIMLYAIPKELTIGGYEVGWNSQPSETDKRFMSQCYPAVVNDTDLIPGGTPFVSDLGFNKVKNLKLNVGFSEGGIYKFWGYPHTLWISIIQNGKVKKYGKGMVQVKLGPGQYTVRVRHSNGGGMFQVSCKKV